MANLIIKLINSVAEVINDDPGVCDRLKVVFVPDFNAKTATSLAGLVGGSKWTEDPGNLRERSLWTVEPPWVVR